MSAPPCTQPHGSQGIPEATVARLPVYLRALYALADRGIATVSSEELAAAAGVNSAKLRKDLSHLGSYGTRGVGLRRGVPRLPGVPGTGADPGLAGGHRRAPATWAVRWPTTAASPPAVSGSRRCWTATRTWWAPRSPGTACRTPTQMEQVVARHGVSIGVIATPAAAAQAVCDRLVAAGVTSILNFAPVVLNVPSGVDVRKVDLSIELQILAFHAQRRVGRSARIGRSGELPARWPVR